MILGYMECAAVRPGDAAQMEAYDLAVCWAELRAASIAIG